ncbi:hypothetical protein PHLCEN_2v2253 [Hermanssonia centrifuga]|uniref:Uncharacterized protein n=1 Tax=Hermanssonia centrifuga TaxID=98765 RepID=A0A2R6RPQ8_9APHY|nr:hypothetical protein PHLCEN_2v2253 [Hermanssonia centrifuga]
MPRIRKKTSNRGTTSRREEIKHKVSETRKKRKKAAKKNPQWKSKHTKDPGIPNNFPYKDQILAEVAEERRQAVEAKQLRKELKKAAKAGAETKGEESEQEGSEAGYDGVTAIHGIKAASGSKNKKEVTVVEENGDNEAPGLINPEWPSLKAVLDAADIVIEVLDARDPLAYRNAHVEQLVKENDSQNLLFILNKIDASPREAVSAWATTLRSHHPTLLFRSASAYLPSSDVTPTKGKGKERADDALGLESVLSILRKRAEEKVGDESLVVAIVGLANSGKSAFVNSLVGKASAPIYRLSSTQDGPSTTLHSQEVVLTIGDKTIRLIDTPGLSRIQSDECSEEEISRSRAHDILVRNKGRIDRLKDPEPVVNEIVTRATREDLMLFYNLPAFAEKDTTAFLSALARANGMIKKGGVLDTVGASRIVLRDWSTGKFPRYATPGPTSLATPADPTSELYTKDEETLSKLPTRKELRKSSGVVKLTPSEVDDRRIALEVTWASADDDESESDGAEGREVELEESGGDEEEDEDEDEEEEDGDEDEKDEDEEEEETTLPVGKRKRGITKASEPVRPAKKVAFSVEPQNTKQARAAAGARGSALAAARKAKAGLKASAAKDKSATPKPSLKAAAPKKVANAASSKKAVPVASSVGEEAYDFKKFF